MPLHKRLALSWHRRVAIWQTSRDAVGAWKLYARWLVDSDKYNEWMNEVDYETEDAATDQDAMAGDAHMQLHITTLH